MIEILFVEDSQSYAGIVRRWFDSSYHITHVPTLAAALTYLDNVIVNAVVLDLGLPDSQGEFTLRDTLDAAGAVPVIVLTGVDSVPGVRCRQLGAADYLCKQDILGPCLVRSVQHVLSQRGLNACVERCVATCKCLAESVH